jgi:hypothetical protein
MLGRSPLIVDEHLGQMIKEAVCCDNIAGDLGRKLAT